MKIAMEQWCQRRSIDPARPDAPIKVEHSNSDGEAIVYRLTIVEAEHMAADLLRLSRQAASIQN